MILRYKFANLCFVIRRLEGDEENKDCTFLFSCRACLSILNTSKQSTHYRNSILSL